MAPFAAPNVTFSQKIVDWYVLRTAEEFEPFARELLDVRAFAHDVETNGKSVWRGARPIGHAFAWRRANGRMVALYAPCRHQSAGLDLLEKTRQIEPEVLERMIKPILEGPALKFGHNYGFDIHQSHAVGINTCAPVVDTMHAMRIIDETLLSYKLPNCLMRAGIPHEHGWKRQPMNELVHVGRHFREKPSSILERSGYAYCKIDTAGRYACQDVAYELKLGEWCVAQNQWPEVWQLEMDLLWCSVDIERVGVPLDSAVLQELNDYCRAEMADLIPRIWSLGHEQFQIKDSELRRILYSKLGYKPPSHTPAGVPKVDDDALWALEQQGCELAKWVRRYNPIEKIATTYTDTIAALTDSHGILHGEFRQTGTKTGRGAMASPNLQNIPIRTPLGRRVRKAFLARRGKVRLCCDYSQIELRVMAHLSQDPVLLRVYREGLDAHSTTAIEAFGTDGVVDGINMRRVGKILNFGCCFCMTEIGLMANINKDLPEGQDPIDEARARGFLDYFYKTYGGIQKYRNWLWFNARNNRGEFENMFGRPRRLPGLNSTSFAEQKACERRAISTAVQGGAADLVKRSMLAAWQYLKSQTVCEADMVLMVHDDLQYDIEYEGVARVGRELRGIMTSTCQSRMSVPIEVDCEYFTTNWDEKRKLRMGA
jgi:DNA polymerase I